MIVLNETPLIATLKGNLPEKELKHETRWEVGDGYVKLIETYKFQGEVVREGAHVLLTKGLTFGM